MLENIRGDSWGSIPPLHMPSLLPHDLCHEWNASPALGSLPFPSPMDHILSDLSTMTCPSWIAPRAWLSFTELDKAVVLVWLDWLVFCEYGLVCLPSMPSCNTYHLTWVSLTLGMGCLFMAAPAKGSHCSLPWTRGISSLPPFLTFNVG